MVNDFGVLCFQIFTQNLSPKEKVLRQRADSTLLVLLQCLLIKVVQERYPRITSKSIDGGKLGMISTCYYGDRDTKLCRISIGISAPILNFPLATDSRVSFTSVGTVFLFEIAI
jgi:hypothetical protein